jgi:hypothetical protein
MCLEGLRIDFHPKFSKQLISRSEGLSTTIFLKEGKYPRDNENGLL